MFTDWDRLFGTFEPKGDAGPVRYRLVHILGTFNPIGAALDEWPAIAGRS